MQLGPAAAGWTKQAMAASQIHAKTLRCADASWAWLPGCQLPTAMAVSLK